MNQQHFNKDLIDDGFGTTKGARWKVPGSPNGHGGMNYLGDDPAAYKRIYEINTKDDKKSWTDLIRALQGAGRNTLQSIGKGADSPPRY